MNSIFFLVMRRMRAPLLALIFTYSVAVLGLVLIPGQDAEGNLWHMDFFHAFYFVSFMASTIGFGEIPYEFTDAQRLWVTFAIFFTVIVWLYSIGTLLTLFQDATFHQALIERRFARRIRQMRESFYLVCGYGETGSALIKALTERNQQAVAIDIRQERVNLLALENLRQYVPALCGDARLPLHLTEAGLDHPLCSGVVAITNSNEANLKIAITAKLLHPDITVICRADSHDIEANMASFGTDSIIDPFDTFAVHFATALQSPALNLLQEWLTSVADAPLGEPIYPPRHGLWVVCGYGRFGRAVFDQLRKEGMEVVVIEATPKKTGEPPKPFVIGRGTEEETLRAVEIERAVGIVAGTDNDANNLSIIMTARALNSDLFVILRQNRKDNEALIEAVKADMVMHPSAIIANRIRVLLGTPLLYELVQLMLYEEDSWACELVSRISALIQHRVPDVWELAINQEQAYAVELALCEHQRVNLAEIMRDPGKREQRLRCIPLLLIRNDQRIMLPAESQRLEQGDRLLFCGSGGAHDRMEWTLQNEHALSYVRVGEAPLQGWLWRWIRNRREV
jgi:Trk K+ transport system NAD-binding subunit